MIVLEDDLFIEKMVDALMERKLFQENGNKPTGTTQDAKDPFKRLKLKMKEYSYDYPLFAKMLKIGTATLSRRMRSIDSWQLSEMYAAMDTLQIPHNELHLYFPKCGVPQKRK